MGNEDKSQMPLFSPKDEKEAQRELERLRKNENVVFKVHHKRTGFEDKTLWDWLQLLGILAIPLVVAGATLFFGIQQANLANQQHDSDLHRATDQQQATTLQTYIDNIQDLLLHDNLQKANPLDNTNPYNDIAVLARARTLTALQVLDPERKARLVKFLHEAQLIGYADFVGLQRDLKKLYTPIIVLHEADLSGVDLSGIVDLGGVDLSYAYLSYADLSYAYLIGANLSAATLNRADLSYAYLSDADLSYAYLSGANLDHANLIFADLSSADLTHANLVDAFLTQEQLDQVSSCKGAILPPGLTCHRNQ